MWTRLANLGLSLSFALLSFSLPLQAQKIDVVLGPLGGGLYGNYFAGVRGGLETNYRVAPYAYGEFDPYNEHVKLGSGYSYNVEVGSALWLSNRWGLNGNVEQSAYSDSIYKTGYFAKGGVALKTSDPWGRTRWFLNYIQQFNNGIDRTGTETAHLRGGQVIYDSDMGCAKHFCNRIYLDVQAGRVLTQGNPICDGTFRDVVGYTCSRKPAWSGGAAIGWVFQFGGR